ncbi:hypothetical protein M378DRAFT_175700 [Amanita muscaria Koide BX008]|uniref:Cullin family profile domain-containing protein n=1 Tax=Amanita muscaria (strain Koide BX008) TaxID=946122 RepID=A0A0C2XLY6_AMAMK|nr:hypothetical protein M378DRAFT_175700 [Amanita muscaria Koide BX008]
MVSSVNSDDENSSSGQQVISKPSRTLWRKLRAVIEIRGLRIVQKSQALQDELIDKVSGRDGRGYVLFTAYSHQTKQKLAVSNTPTSYSACSRDLTDFFKVRMAANHPDDQDITFSIMVLGTNFWPLNLPTHDFVILTEIATTYYLFRKYYQTKHSGRKLVHDTLSLEEIQAATAVSKDILFQMLALLVKAKVLINEGNDQYDLNPNYKSKKIRVNLNQPIKAEVKAESSDVLKAVHGDRKYVIQATIVRIMKARKTLKNQPLIQEVIPQISQRFAPKIPDVKKASYPVNLSNVRADG